MKYAKPKTPVMRTDPIQHKLRKAITTGMTDGTLVTIAYVSGFEKFGAYETWAQGWEVKGEGTKGKLITASDEDLNTAVDKWIKAYND